MVCNRTRREQKEDELLVFINRWNEWAATPRGLPAVYNDPIMSRPQTRRSCSSPTMTCVSAISTASWRRGYERYLEKWGN